MFQTHIRPKCNAVPAAVLLFLALVWSAPVSHAAVTVEFPGPVLLPTPAQTTAGCELPGPGGGGSRFLVGTDNGFVLLMSYQVHLGEIRTVGSVFVGGSITSIAYLPDPGDLVSELVVGTSDPDQLVFVDLGTVAPFLSERDRFDLEEDPGAVAALHVAGGSTPRVVVALPGVDRLVTAIRNGDGWRREAGLDAGDRPVDLVAADLDGDGSAELVVANGGALSRSLHGFTVVDGVLAFDHELLLPAAPRALAVLTGAGADQLAVAVADTALAWSVVPAAGVLVLQDTIVLRVQADDLDFARLYDGRVGLYAASSTRGLVEVVLGDGSSWSPGEIYYPSCRPTRLLAADYDGDAQIDVVSLGSELEAATIMFASGTGTLFGYPVLSLSGQPASATLGDLDLDGFPDAVVGIGGAAVLNSFLGDGTGLQPSPISQVIPFVPGSMTLCQVDSDPTPELVVVSVFDGIIWIMDWQGSEGFLELGTLDLDMPTVKVSADDVDGDGFQDLVVLGTERPEIRICYGAGDGNFNDVRIESFLWQARNVVVVDLDADGRKELVSADGQGRVSYSANLGGREFGGEVRLNADSGSRLLTLGDLDGDLDEDVIVGNVVAGSLTLLENDGNGNLVRRIGSYALAASPTSVLAEDINQDGILDLVVNLRSEGVLNVHYGLGGWAYTQPQEFVGGDDVFILLSDDLNGDLVPDLLTLDETLELGLTMLNVERVPVANEPSALTAICRGDVLEIGIRPGVNFSWDLEARRGTARWHTLAGSAGAVVGDLQSADGGWRLRLDAQDLAGLTPTGAVLELRLVGVTGPDGAARVLVQPCLGGTTPPLTWAREPWPNPFNPLVHARVRLANSGFVEAGIYDLRGRLVKRLLAAEIPAGEYQLGWDGRTGNGPAATGIYLLHI
ncbi:hypothetical protein DRQ50_12590, partial [bacterium]